MHGQQTLSSFLLLTIITNVGVTNCCSCHPLLLHLHHFSTASLFSQPHPIVPSRPNLYTYHPNPQYHHQSPPSVSVPYHHCHVCTSPHCTVIRITVYILFFTSGFYILHKFCFILTEDSYTLTHTHTHTHTNTHTLSLSLSLSLSHTHTHHVSFPFRPGIKF
jgi:hypothetical protein